MQYIEIKSEGYTYRYDFEPVPSTAESLDICLDLLSCIFGKEDYNIKYGNGAKNSW